MLLHELRQGMMIHHTSRTKIGAGGIVVPIKAQVGGVKRLWSDDQVLVTLRGGRENRLISGTTDEVKKELENWHEGTGFDCVVCALEIERKLTADVVQREEIDRSTEDATLPELEIEVGG